MKRLLAPPVFEDDEDKTRIAGLLNTILLAAIAGMVMLIIATPLVSADLATLGVYEGALVALVLSALFLMRRGYVRLASVLSTFGIWAYLTLAIFAFGGIRSPNVASYISVVLIAGFLGGWRAGAGFAGLSVLAGLGMLHAETSGILPPPAVPLTPAGWWVALTVNLIMAIGLQHVATRSINDALERARKEIAERKRVEEALKRRAKQLAALNATLLDITAQHGLSTLLRTIVERATQLLGGTGGGLYVCDPERREVRCVISYNTPRDYTGVVLPYGEGAAGTVAATGQPLMIDDYRTWSGRAAACEEDLPFRAVLSVPMLWQGQVVGVIHVIDSELQRFHQEDLELLSLFAKQAAIAVENTRLLEAEQQSRQAAEALHEQVQRQADELGRRVAERTRELAEANRRLVELDRLKSKFVTDISHELRTPIANLNIYVDLLDRGKPDKQPQYLATLKEQVHRLVSLVEDALDISHLEIDSTGATLTPIDLNALVNQVVTALRSRTIAAGLTLAVELRPDLPHARGARDLLLRVVAILTENAIRYTPHGQVRVGTDLVNDQVCLWVQDTGRGIEPEDRPHIFERFYRGRSVSNIPGSGLGLAIVKEIVDLHGGKIEVESEVGVGSVFKVWLPPSASSASLR